MRVELHDNREYVFDSKKKIPKGQLTIQDELVLKKYCRGKKLCVELGTFKGRSAAIISLFADRVVTIDAFSWAHTTYESVKKRLRPFGVEVIKSISWKAAKRFEDESIDVLFVDAGHAYDDVMNDFEAFYPKVKRNGIFIFHDYKYMVGNAPDKAVKPAVDDICKESQVSLVETRGWCAVVRKDK